WFYISVLCFSLLITQKHASPVHLNRKPEPRSVISSDDQLNISTSAVLNVTLVNEVHTFSESFDQTTMIPEPSALEMNKTSLVVSSESQTQSPELFGTSLKIESRFFCRIMAVLNNSLMYNCIKWSLLYLTGCRHFKEYILHMINVTCSPMNVLENSTNNRELFKMSLVNTTKALNNYVGVMKTEVKKEFNRLCTAAVRMKLPCRYPAACYKDTPASGAMLYCYLRHTLSYLTDLKYLMKSVKY
ncbi:uncharacterized protein LOC115213514 isoform X1, partial [Argonauta hians]